MTDARVLRRRILNLLAVHHRASGGEWMADEDLLLALGDESVNLTIEALASELIYLRDCEIHLPGGAATKGYLELRVHRLPRDGEQYLSRIKPAGLDLLDRLNPLADPRIAEF
jgi:hypothetical protein